MVKKSKQQPDDHQEEGQFIEIPDDRLEQIEKDEPSEELPVQKPKRKASAPRKKKQVEVPEEAPEKEPVRSEFSGEDLLADIRQELVTEEKVVEPKGFFGRIRSRLKKTEKTKEEESKEIEAAKTQEQLDALLEQKEEIQEAVIEPRQRKTRPSKSKVEEKAIQEFFADLEAFADIEPEEYVPSVREEQEPAPEVVQKADQVPLPKLPVKSEEEVDIEAVREVALQEYDETKVEVEERKPALREEVRQTIRELKPLERFLLYGAGAITVFVLLFSGITLIVNSVPRSAPTPTAEIDPAEMVHPTQLTLPGGWEFRLGQGKVVEGEWRPQRAEWLVGTEISRWVALPWSLQLEAVLRTLKPEDQLELTMSNLDVLAFNVYSIRELSMDQLLATDPKTPSLLVVLYNDEEGEGTYWVVEARPSEQGQIQE